MAKKMLIDATHAEETRVVVVDGNKVEEFDFETINKRQLAGNIYLAKVTRVEPSLQAAFVDYGGNRHGFLAFAEIHPDYYQIPVADREALLEEERQLAEAAAEEEEKPKSRRRRSRRSSNKAEKAKQDDAVVSSDEIPGMGVVDPEAEDENADAASEEAEADAQTETSEAPAEEAPASEAAEKTAAVEAAQSDEDDSDDSDEDDDDAAEADSGIESVADEDVEEEIRPARKPRPRRYKIQEVIKVRQIMLVQVVKEERGNKGAALTTYLSLAGRYCVLMPNTARGGGISRKITNAADRKKLKEIAGELDVPKGAGLIVRTAGAQRTKTEIKRDYEYLMRLWEQIRDLTMKSVAPAPIYEEGDLIKRSIRDLYNKDIDEVLVEGERGYRAAKAFMKMIMPSHAKNVKHYSESLPLFARHQVESYLASMFNPTVQLKSGGYIVIGVTEALVAIDVNSGRATKEGSIEETALKTNLEAADEVARQLRLRDLAGLIVIDFIDMDERKNNSAVEKRMKERLKTDRARIQVGRISGFGLLEMSRQRLRPGMIESTTQPCAHCHGTGLIRSDDSLALSVLRAIEEEGTRKRTREVLVRAPVAVANYLMNAKREHVAVIEARYGMSVRIEAAPELVSPDFTIEKFKTATRNVAEVDSPVVSASASLMAEIDEAEDETEAEAEAQTPEVETEAEEQPKKKRRRRRRRKKSNGENGENNDSSENGDQSSGDQKSDDQKSEPTGGQDAPAKAEPAQAAEAPADEAKTEAQTDVKTEAQPEEEAPKPKRRSRARKKVEEPKADAETAEAAVEGTEAKAEEEAPKPKRRTRSRKKVDPEADAQAAVEGSAAGAKVEAAAAEEEAPKPKRRSRARKKVEEPVAETPESPEPPETPQPDAPTEPQETPQPDAPVETPEPTPQETPADVPQETPPAPEPETPFEQPPETPQPDAPVELPGGPAFAETEAEGETMTEEAPKPKKRGWWSR
ncbi:MULTISPECIES: Rne/Rng family ribonuclease [Thioclava]|uniref:Rne/Rng family ribonuclease n=1 Tax=Thioclava TaxID=285107 RepID=UPI000D60CFC6|nr:MULTISPECIES: Rne/Rng family ribonuclease [Thioclava]PWE49906.1 ribonuclease E/G [Thioclava sp. NG1]WGT50645.1 Rne/Rng family ribonuclease [Thioclava nitratireducens]